VPFWTYDAAASARYSGRGGHVRTRRDREGRVQSYVEWHYVSGYVERNFDDVLVCASQNSTGTLINKVVPYNTTSDIYPFASEYLSGYTAEMYSIDGRAGFETARRKMEAELRSSAQNDIRRRGYDRASVESLQAQYRNVTYKNVLLPMYRSQYN
jgi:hypothetical protein